MKITGDFERFQCFSLKEFFLKNEIFFQTAGVPFFDLKY